jgi:hypothetical protein
MDISTNAMIQGAIAAGATYYGTGFLISAVPAVIPVFTLGGNLGLTNGQYLAAGLMGYYVYNSHKSFLSFLGIAVSV